jgi:CubicO group peptidase (beta-lactamase class C family)/ketosteroid isomerase-like protein
MSKLATLIGPGARAWLAHTTATLALAVLPLPVGAAAADTSRLPALLQALSAQQQAMGGLAVSVGDAPPLLLATGQARLEGAASTPATPDTRYHVGSISKLFTAVMVMQLAQEGRLSLQDPLSRWYPALPQAQTTTVAHLLGHRSGLGDIKDLPGFDAQWMFDARGESELLQAIATLPVQFAPGTRARYNNSGYILLSFVVERAGGLPYAQALQQRISGPLGLHGTRFDPSPAEHAADARHYRWRDDKQGGWQAGRSTHPSVPQGAGGVISTPRDLVVFVRALFKGRLLQDAGLQQMTTLSDGFGLGIYPLPGAGPAPDDVPWGHEGVIDGFAATLAYFPRSDTALAWCGNAYRLPRDDVLRALRSALFEPGERVPTFAPMQASATFKLELGPQPSGRVPATMSLRGDAAPLSWQHSLPLVHDAASGLWQARVTLAARDGVPLQYKYLVGDEGWERTPNRELRLQAGQDQVVQDRFGQDPAGKRLQAEILVQDARLFDAFNRQDVAEMGRVFSERLEFFHDRTGLTGHADNMRLLAENFKRKPSVQRELVPGSTEVFALGEFGAMQSSTHLFCRTEAGKKSCEAYRFMHVWERTGGGWRLLRVVSYDH